MKNALAILALALSLLIPLHQQATADSQTWTVHFSPTDGCTKAIVNEPKSAKKIIQVQTYPFTSEANSQRLARCP
jgi:hypothetical protein